jgi:hypothetical protein
LAGDEGGATADERGSEEFFAGPGFHGDNELAGGEETYQARRGSSGEETQKLHQGFCSVGRVQFVA